MASASPTTPTSFVRVVEPGWASPSTPAKPAVPTRCAQALEALEPDRIGHGVHSADDASVLAMLRERGTVLEVCPSSNLNTGVLRSHADLRRVVRALVDGGVRFTVSTDGPEMLRSYLRDELAMLMRHEILSLDEVRRAIETGERATFLDRAPVIETSVAGREPAGNGHAPIPVEVGS